MKPISAVSYVLLAMTLVLLAGAAQAGIYRWVDEDGTIHYTDTIPPSQAQRARTKFGAGGVPEDHKPRAKTSDEIQTAQELERLHAQQQRLIQELRTADRVLLRSFQTEEDLFRTRDSQIAAVDVMIQITKSNMHRKLESLSALRAEAANMERAGRQVPKHLKDNIRVTEAAIQDARKVIAVRGEQKTAIRANFEQDLARFKHLRENRMTDRSYASQALHPVYYEVLPCRSDAECTLYWDRSMNFLNAKTDLRIQSRNGRNILIMAPQSREHEINLILSRIQDSEGPGATLFLELQCLMSLGATEMCQSPEVAEVVEGFQRAITEDQGAAVR